MPRLFAVCLAVAMFAVPAAAARAAGQMPTALQGSTGALAPNGKTRYVALGAADHTVLAAIDPRTGAVRRTLELDGSFGLPVVAYDGTHAGISADGRTLVLAGTLGSGTPSFRIVDTRAWKVRASADLRGSFAYDALSPDGSKLYLIQYRSLNDVNHYVVRLYDTRAQRLVPGRVADKTQKTWIMQGQPLTRTTSPGGRWVYTLYSNPGGYPFVHALDTVAGVAHCVGLPWHGSQDVLWSARLRLEDGGGRLAVVLPHDKTWLTVAQGDWRISFPAAGGSPWLWPVVGSAIGLLLAAVAASLLRRRFREERKQRSREQLGVA